MKKIISFLKKYKLAVLSGFLVGTSYIPLPPWAILFCYTPLWWFWLKESKSWKETFIAGATTQFVFNLIGFFWIITTAHDFGQLPWIISFLALIAFAFLSHLYVPAVGLLSLFLIKKLKFQNTLRSGLLIATLWCLFEIYWPYLFQWHMGYTLLWGKFPIFHFADIIGFHGLSLVLLVFNAHFLAALELRSDKNLFFKKAATYLIAFFILNLLGSYYGYQFQQQMKSYPQKKFLAVQGNIGNLERIYAERGAGYQDYIATTFITLTEKALKNSPETDVIVWPESAYPEYLDPHYLDSARAKTLISQVQLWNKTLLTGSYSKDSTQVKKRQTYNAMSIFEKSGVLNSESPYQKHHLLAFGEYTPFANIFPILEEISPAGSGFGRGSGARSISVDGFLFGPQICYESLYPEFSRQLALQNAQIIINITNDSWFGKYFEPQQHLFMTLARGIENRLPVLRVTNTGITTAMDPDGTLFEESPMNEEWVHLYDMHLKSSSSLTLFTRFGHLLPVLILLILGGLIVIERKQFKK